MTWAPPQPTASSHEIAVPLAAAFRPSEQPRGALADDHPLPALEPEQYRRFRAWAEEHDGLLSSGLLADAKCAADEAALKAHIAQLRQRLDKVVASAPEAIRKAWASERGTSFPPSEASPFFQTWELGGLSRVLQQHSMSAFETTMTTITNRYQVVVRKNAMLRGSAIRTELMPSYESARRHILRVEKLREPVTKGRATARNNNQRNIRELALAVATDLDALNRHHDQTLATMAPSAHAFDDEVWSSWEPPDRVREILWYWQSVPEGLVGAVAGAGSPIPTGRVRNGEAVGDFRTVPGFVWPNATGQQNEVAAAGVRAMVLRLMAAVPPGKARFTFIDPLGSGNNVAPFLELAEWDPLLVDSKAWCQQREIAEKLVELNAHLELVIQKYLKGRFESIEDYNIAAGEVAEPYRFVVVFDYPAQFDEQSNHLLARLIQNGRRCGVYVLIAHNSDQGTPYGVNLPATVAGLHRMPIHTGRASAAEELRRPSMSVPDYMMDGSNLAAPALAGNAERARLICDAPPELRFDRDSPTPSLFTRIMLAVGESGKGSNEVVVIPERVNELVGAAMAANARSDMPAASAAVRLDDVQTWWTASSAQGISVPIGRSGARDAAMFTVDTAILSGGLVVGRPGSGKSTLMHSIICGAASWYSPEEVELYLLDFKQGVEFLSYGELGLPHARCVAVESEREFGVAILESVANELTARADRFKDAGPGIVNITDWRARTGEPMPRIIVVIDEFQELLNRSDALATRAAQFLDNLIRQGRAFGIHVLLGSQSLSSIDAAGTGVNAVFRLLPIRIVLPSDATDAAAALGDRNDAAQFLTRQGEGVYNAAGGNPEHNVRFQGTLLTDQQRHAIIAAARRRADNNGFIRRPRVFNGQVPATVEAGAAEFVAEMRAGAPRSLRVPIGVPVTLDPDLTIELAREAGANLAFVCRDQPLVDGLGVVMTAALASQTADRGGALHFVDCTPVDEGADEWLQPFLTSGALQTYRPRALPGLLTQLRTLTAERLDHDLLQEPPTVLVLWGAHRARDLDPAGGGFGVVTQTDEPDASADLEWIIRNGPEVGVHVVLWADSPASLGRRLTAASIRDCGWRLAGHLNEMDADRFEVRAGSLKPNQLALAHTDTERQWRVRGYSRPSTEWASQAAASI